MNGVPSACWAADPSGRHEWRWWDGRVWTEHVRDGDQSGVDALVDVPGHPLAVAHQGTGDPSVKRSPGLRPFLPWKVQALLVVCTFGLWLLVWPAIALGRRRRWGWCTAWVGVWALLIGVGALADPPPTVEARDQEPARSLVVPAPPQPADPTVTVTVTTTTTASPTPSPTPPSPTPTLQAAAGAGAAAAAKPSVRAAAPAPRTTSRPKPARTATAAPKPRPSSTPRRTRSVAPEPPPAAAYYANCDAARAAGVAPLLRGEPGYRAGLDRDDDGVACE